MRRGINRILALLCVSFLLCGCQGVKETETAKAIEEEEEIRAAFTDGTEREEREKTEKKSLDAITASDETYDYVVLGNSVTCSVAEGTIWWGNWGMAATSKDKDYVHLISSWLKEEMERPVTTMVLDLKKWEVSQNRYEILEKYEGYFGEHTDLVTIQTGENITDFKDTLDSDYQNLVAMIRKKAPNAQILMLGEVLWPSEDIEAAKKKACEANGITFVGMEAFLKDYQEVYRSSIGAQVTGADGKMHKINDEAVAAHPNDKGMACISEQVIKQITIENQSVQDEE